RVRSFSWLGLAKIRRVATPPVPAATAAPTVDLEGLKAVITNRMHVLRAYTQRVTLPVLRREIEALGENANGVVSAVKRWLSWQPHMLDAHARERLAERRPRHPHFAKDLQLPAGREAPREGPAPS